VITQPTAAKGERRWPMALAVLTMIVLQVVTPRRGRVPGWWILAVLELVLLIVLIVQDPGRIDDPSPATRRTTVALLAVMTAATLGGVFVLAFDILTSRLPFGLIAPSELNATNLLGRGAALWATNVIVFSLWYWQFDRGGPAGRLAGNATASFAFAEDATPELAPDDWVPAYPDYLYLAFTNATAFSPTDTLPVRTWAKMTMMLQSSLALMIAILVVARAINMIGST